MPPKVPADLSRHICDVLPQTQCQRCGYADCTAYASAIAHGQAGINQCPPGGAAGIEQLSRVTGLPVIPLSPDHGQEGPRSVVWIDETWCIGCTLCIQVCPVDAIVGANKLMHTVLEDECNGCELCLPVCPVDCILTENASGTATGWSAWSIRQADSSRARYAARQLRLERLQVSSDQQRIALLETKASDLSAHSQITDPEVLGKKRTVIEMALQKARAKAGPSGQ